MAEEYECRRCGACCGEFFFNVTDLPDKLIEFLELRNSPPWGIFKLTTHKGEKVLRLAVPVHCRHLEPPNVCNIYEDRPDYCRVYLCNRYKKKKLKEEVSKEQ